MKRVLFIAAIYSLIIHQCTKKAKMEITGNPDQPKVQISAKAIQGPIIQPAKETVNKLTAVPSFARDNE